MLIRLGLIARPSSGQDLLGALAMETFQAYQVYNMRGKSAKVWPDGMSSVPLGFGPRQDESRGFQRLAQAPCLSSIITLELPK